MSEDEDEVVAEYPTGDEIIDVRSVSSNRYLLTENVPGSEVIAALTVRRILVRGADGEAVYLHLNLPDMVFVIRSLMRYLPDDLNLIRKLDAKLGAYEPGHNVLMSSLSEISEEAGRAQGMLKELGFVIATRSPDDAAGPAQSRE